jgi:hypothetical protein
METINTMQRIYIHTCTLWSPSPSDLSESAARDQQQFRRVRVSQLEEETFIPLTYRVASLSNTSLFREPPTYHSVSWSYSRSSHFVWSSAPVGVGMRATWISRLQESLKSSKTTASKLAKLSAGVERRPKPTELRPAGPMDTLSLKSLPPARNVLKVSSISTRQTMT